MVSLNTLSRTTKRPQARVGRGGKRGKTSGKGTKGQNARAGSRPRPELRDVIKKMPKRRGYGKNRGRTVNDGRVSAIPVSLSRIDAVFAAGDVVSPKTLVEKKVINVRGKKFPKVKVLANGEITKKVTIENCLVSASAKAAIEKAGGNVAE